MRFFLFLLVSAVAITALSDAATKEKRSAVIGSFEGGVQVKRSGENIWTDAKGPVSLTEGDMIRTKKDSGAVIDIRDGKTLVTVEITESSQVGFLTFVKDALTGATDTLLDIVSGEVIISSSKIDKSKNRFALKTPTSVINIPDEGSSFKVKVSKQSD